MLQEVRKIVFPKDVLIQYLVNECKASGLEIPASPAESLLVEGQDPIKVSLKFATAPGAKPVVVPFEEAFILGAMIAACREYKVPLSRSADKGLQAFKDSLCMTMVTSTRKPSEALGADRMFF